MRQLKRWELVALIRDRIENMERELENGCIMSSVEQDAHTILSYIAEYKENERNLNK